MQAILPYIVDSLLYAGLAGWFWKSRSQRTAARPSGPPPASPGFVHWAMLVPLALHGWLVFAETMGGNDVRLSVGLAISAIAFLSVAIYWLSSFVYNLEGLYVFVTPVAALGCLLPVLLPAPHPLTNTAAPAFKAHLFVSLLSYSLFTIASLHVLLMALQEKRLHGGRIAAALRNLPPLLTMEKILFQIIWAGFALLTATLASGVLFSEEVFGRAITFNHKTLFAIVSWVIFALLLAGRQVYGWRGRTAMRWTLAGFSSLVLAYIGSRFVLEVILQRA